MSMGGSSGGGTQTVKTELDPTVKPYVDYGLSESQRLYQSGPMEFYPGQTYVGPSQMTQTGMQAAQQRAMAGSSSYTRSAADRRRSTNGNQPSTRWFC